jgi:predicted nucleic-acid-binding Zn-ribbon protein
LESVYNLKIKCLKCGYEGKEKVQTSEWNILLPNGEWKKSIDERPRLSTATISLPNMTLITPFSVTVECPKCGNKWEKSVMTK